MNDLRVNVSYLYNYLKAFIPLCSNQETGYELLKPDIGSSCLGRRHRRTEAKRNSQWTCGILSSTWLVLDTRFSFCPNTVVEICNCSSNSFENTGSLFLILMQFMPIWVIRCPFMLYGVGEGWSIVFEIWKNWTKLTLW